MKEKTVTFMIADLGFPQGVTTEEAIRTHHAADVSTKVTLIILSVADLGFSEEATTGMIIGTDQDTDQHGNAAPFTSGRAQWLGAELCPPKVAPSFILEAKDLPLGERWYVAMKPIATPDGEPRIFTLEHNAKGLSLDAARARPDDRWHLTDKFMFCIHKKKQI